MVSFVTSKYGNNLAVHGGYEYTHHRKRKRTGEDVWRCCRLDLKCNAMLVIWNDDAVRGEPPTHGHSSDWAGIKAREVVSKNTSEARSNPNALPSDIIRKHVSKLEEEGADRLSKRGTLKRKIRIVENATQNPRQRSRI